MESISVSVRVRPLNSQEEASNEFCAWRVDGNSIVQLDPNTREPDRTRDNKYCLDHVFGQEWTTERIYEVTTQSLIHKVVSGFNSTVFAYGQTSSGKTHTMRGTADSDGIIPLAVSEAFRLITSDLSREFLIRVSYMELYNEEVNDLLAPENTKLPIHESKEKGTYVAGLREEIATSPEQVLGFLKSGEANRHIGSTKMNEKSSRSHTIFRMVVESRDVNAQSDDAGAILVSTLTLVDLAGSERVAKTGAEGLRMKEGNAINKSLLTLGNCINKLSEGAPANGVHIPYRDSKLTRILQPSLGGNTKTAIICAMTPALCHVEESHSTLRFASRAKRVMNNAVVNEVVSDSAVLKRQAKEIEHLKRQLQDAGVSADVHEQINSLRAQLLRSEQEKELIRVKLQEEQLEREKAQNKADNAIKMLLQPRGEPGEVQLKKQSRRETWCPGQSAWAAPPGPSDATSGQANTPGQASPSQSGGGATSGQRKRGFGRLDSAGPGKSSAELSTLLEEEDEGSGMGEGRTPRRRRRECSLPRMEDVPEEEEDEEEDEEEEGESEGGATCLERILASLPGQERAVLNRIVQQHQDAEQRLQHELSDMQQTVLQQQEDARCASNELEAVRQQQGTLTQNLEQAKWQTRQLEKSNKELEARLQASEKERKDLEASSAQRQAGIESQYEDLNARHKELQEAHASAKAAILTLKSELSDTRAKLELSEYQAGLRETKITAHGTEMEEANAKLKEKVEELEAARRSLAAAEERAADAEGRQRELYERNKRLENHVSELESRKRAPLYQKKQEEELKAALEKAQECEVRAVQAELGAKEMREELEAVRKQLAELQEEKTAAEKQATRAREELVERHAVEVQRLTVEGTLQQERHEEAVAALRTQFSELQADMAKAEGKLAAKDQRVAELERDTADLRSKIVELETSAAEHEACATAARERMAYLEEEVTALQAASAVREQAFKEVVVTQEQAQTEATAARDTLASAVAEHERIKAELEEQLAGSKADVSRLEGELRLADERAAQLVKASLDQSQEASQMKAELQRQVDELSAKVHEAGGALKAKEELKEERLRSKQEIAALKAEMQKLQLESKSGAKGKDMAQKELDNLKKRLTDAETKLRTALQDKAAALQEKGNLERQLKQHQSQKMMIEKTLEKKDAIESKKRESIMVNLNKSKEQLSSVEERSKQLAVDLQKVQMDLTAKQNECKTLEEQLHDQQAENERLREQSNKLSDDCTELRSQLEASVAQQEETSGQLAALQLTHDGLVAEQQDLALQRSRLEQDVQELADQLQAAAQNHADQLAAAEAKTEQLKRGLSLAEAEAKQQLEAAALSSQQLSIQLAEANAEVQRLSTELDVANKEVQRLASGATAMEQASAKQDELLSAAQMEVQRLTDLSSEADRTAQQLRASLAAQEQAAAESTRLSASQLAEAETKMQQLTEQLAAAHLDGQQLRRQLAEQAQAAGAEAELTAGRLRDAESNAQRLAEEADCLREEVGRLQSQLAAVQHAVDEAAQSSASQLTAAEAEMSRLTQLASQWEAEVQRLRSHNETQQRVAEQAAQLAADQLADTMAEVQRLSEQAAKSGREVQRLQVLIAAQQETAGEGAHLAAGKLADAEMEVRRLAELAGQWEKEVERLRSCSAAQQQAAEDASQRSVQRLVDATAEAERLKEQLAEYSEEMQHLRSNTKAVQQAADDAAQLSATKLADANTEICRLTALAGQWQEEVQRLRSSIAAQQLAAEQAAQLASDKLMDAEVEAQRLQVQVRRLTEEVSRQHEAGEAAPLEVGRSDEAEDQLRQMATRLAEAESTVQRLESALEDREKAATATVQYGMVLEQGQLRSAHQQHAGESAPELAGGALDATVRCSMLQVHVAALKNEADDAAQTTAREAELEAELQRTCGQLQAAQEEAAMYNQQVASLSAIVRDLETQLAQQPATHLLQDFQRGHVQPADGDTMDLLSSPAVPNATRSGAFALERPIVAGLEKQLADYTAEIEAKSAALAAEGQRAAALELELVATRNQLMSAQANAATHMNATQEVTRSFAVSVAHKQVNELRTQVEQLQQQLADMEFTKDEELERLGQQISAASQEREQRLQQIEELQRQCAFLEEELASLRSGTCLAQAQTVQQMPPAPSTSLDMADATPGGAPAHPGGGATAADVLALEARNVELEASLLEERVAKEQLARIIDDLSVRVAEPAQEAIELASAKQAVAELHNRDMELQNRVAELQTAADATSQQLGALNASHAELQQRYDSLVEQHAQVSVNLAGLQMAYATLVAETEKRAARNSDANLLGGVVEGDLESENRSLQSKLASATQRQQVLEAELSDVQASCNAAVAGKHTFEQETRHRIMELETANIGLKDELAKLRSSQSANRGVSAASPAEPEILAAECDQLKTQLQALEAGKSKAEEKARSLKEALVRLESTLQAAKAEAAAQSSAADEERASLQVAVSELEVQCEDLTKEVADKSAEVEALRLALAQEAEQHTQARQQGEELAERVKQQLHEVSTARNEAAELRARNTAVQTEAESGAVQALQANVVALQTQLRDCESLKSMLEQQVLKLTQEHCAVCEQLRALMREHSEQLVAAEERAHLAAEKAALEQGLAEAQRALEEREAAFNAEMEKLKQKHLEAVDEIKMSAEQCLAELNGQHQKLLSQIHWLQEENDRLRTEQEQQAVQPAPGAPADVLNRIAWLEGRVQHLEDELRTTKRSELKLLALHYRLRKDLAAAGGDAQVAALQNLQDTRALQYDVDRLSGKCKRFETEKTKLQEQLDAKQLELDALQRGAGPKAQFMQGANGSVVLADKENMPNI